MDNNSILDRNFFYESNINLVNIEQCNQGISWGDIRQDREKLRDKRTLMHKGHRNSPEKTWEKIARMNFHSVHKNMDIFYQYNSLIKEIPLVVQHFQLRRGLKFINTKELIYFRSFGIEKMNIVNNKRSFLILYPNEESTYENKMVTFDTYEKDNGDIILAAGKINSQIIYYNLNKEELSKPNKNGVKCDPVRKTLTNIEGNQIVNHINFMNDGKQLFTCCNDGKIRILDIEHDFKEVISYQSKDAVNHSTFNTSNNILAAVGDFEDVDLFDPRTSNKIACLSGHSDFGFVSRFHPTKDYILATGNQDYNCRLWDMRNINQYVDGPSACYKTLYGHFEAVGELRFIDDDMLVFAENCDYIHIYDMKNDTLQSLDYFGNISGFDYHTGNKKLYIGIYESAHSGIMTYDKIINYQTNISTIY